MLFDKNRKNVIFFRYSLTSSPQRKYTSLRLTLFIFVCATTYYFLFVTIINCCLHFHIKKILMNELQMGYILDHFLSVSPSLKPLFMTCYRIICMRTCEGGFFSGGGREEIYRFCYIWLILFAALFCHEVKGFYFSVVLWNARKKSFVPLINFLAPPQIKLTRLK